MKSVSYLSLVTALGVTAASAAAQTQPPIPAHLPMKHAAHATVPAITPQDLMTRLYIFADDSMGGRPAGTVWNDKGTEYIASEVKRLGLKPAGDNGTYFQSAHLFTRGMDSTSTITVDGKTYVAGTDFLGSFQASTKSFTSGAVMYGGLQLDTTSIPDMTDKVVIMDMRQAIQFTSNAQVQQFVASEGYKKYLAAQNSAAAVIVISPTDFTDARRQLAYHPPVSNTQNIRVPLLGQKPAPVTLTVSKALGEAMLGTAITTASRGAVGKTISADLKYVDYQEPGRNVVAILEGRDPKLKGSYVAVGAHNDHIPMRGRPIDHDSIRAYLTLFQTGGAEGPPVGLKLTPELWTKINAMKDSLRAAHGGVVRMDSINNGADDDGSGSMGVLEIAEAFAKAPMALRPKRSIIFVWHVGEELGMFGSEYFTDHPTVPRDSIVAQLNVDMIGRGAVGDPVAWPGDSYLQLIGSKRLSTELGAIVEQVNVDTKAGFKYDYQFDANGEEHNFYCRSDHWAYGRYGIPIAFFTTGGHRDYHQVTDEPQYIDYNHYSKVAQLIHDIAVRVSNLEHRPVVDGKKGDPYGTCQQ